MKARNYRWHLSFRVGGKVKGYDATVEAISTSQRGAAMKIRNRIRAMQDVADDFKFHASEIVKGKPVLEADGHDDNGLNKTTYPRPLRAGAMHKRIK